MTKFKIGDWVECINFDGATGTFFTPSTAYQITAIGTLDRSLESRGRLLYFDGILDGLGELSGAYSERFIPSIHFRDEVEDEYDDIIEAQDIYKSIIDS